MSTKENIGVVLPAGGKGLRAGGETPKQYQELQVGYPVWRYALEILHSLEEVTEIIIPLPALDISMMTEALKPWPKAVAIPGGAQRWESVRNGVEALSPNCRTILIHDVARPFLSEAVVRRCIGRCDGVHSVIAALPAVDTMKEIRGERIIKTLPRASLVNVQTPQVFPRSVLEQVYANALEELLPTDEAQLVEAQGFPVVWVEGDLLLRKITTEEDLLWARWIGSTWK